MTAASAKPLFRAISGQGSAVDARQPGLSIEAGHSARTRNDHDLYPTYDPAAIRALIAADGPRLRQLGAVWEPAAGLGHLAAEIRASGLQCVTSDVADHGCPGVQLRSFYDFADSPAPAIITNPPYADISAKPGRCKWLRHTLSMPGWRYCAYLLGWGWPAAQGTEDVLDAAPFSYSYLLRFRIDFTGRGAPPQTNAWFVWDRDYPGCKEHRFLRRPGSGPDDRQAVLI